MEQFAANMGRFLSVDPFIFEPGNSQAINPYTYIFNNPLSGIDPTGYSPETDSGNDTCSEGNCNNSTNGNGYNNANKNVDNGQQNQSQSDTPNHQTTPDGNATQASAAGVLTYPGTGTFAPTTSNTSTESTTGNEAGILSAILKVITIVGILSSIPNGSMGNSSTVSYGTWDAMESDDEAEEDSISGLREEDGGESDNEGGTETKGAGKPEVGDCPDCGGKTSNKPGKIAQEHGVKVKEVKKKIHAAKQQGKIEGNPDVETCLRCGEMFPQTDSGGLGDSIGNLEDN